MPDSPRPRPAGARAGSPGNCARETSATSSTMAAAMTPETESHVRTMAHDQSIPARLVVVDPSGAAVRPSLAAASYFRFLSKVRARNPGGLDERSGRAKAIAQDVRPSGFPLPGSRLPLPHGLHCPDRSAWPPGQIEKCEIVFRSIREVGIMNVMCPSLRSFLTGFAVRAARAAGGRRRAGATAHRALAGGAHRARRAIRTRTGRRSRRICPPREEHRDRHPDLPRRRLHDPAPWTTRAS